MSGLPSGYTLLEYCNLSTSSKYGGAPVSLPARLSAQTVSSSIPSVNFSAEREVKRRFAEFKDSEDEKRVRLEEVRKGLDEERIRTEESKKIDEENRIKREREAERRRTEEESSQRRIRDTAREILRHGLEGPSSSSSQWACFACTYINASTSEKCEICGAVKPPGSGGSSTPQAAKWKCQTCYFENKHDSPYCEMCTAGKP